MSEESRIIHNGNNLAPARKGKDLCTRDEAAQIAHSVAIHVTDHLARQIPGLVGTVVEAALKAYDESVRVPTRREKVTRWLKAKLNGK